MCWKFGNVDDCCDLNSRDQALDPQGGEVKLPRLPKMPQQRAPYLRIGNYWLSRFGREDFWIEHESGEGMQVTRKVMEELIHAFYKENF